MTEKTGERSGRLWWDDPRHATPWMPEDRDHRLADLAVDVIAASAKLDGAVPPPARIAISSLLRFVNSYYSNLIEGHVTLPRDIERAMRHSYADDPTRRNLQIEARVHVEVERRMRHRLTADPSLAITSSEFIGRLHRDFFQALPSDMRIARSSSGREVQIIPGAFRTEEVIIGDHEPPTHLMLSAFLQAFGAAYKPSRLSRTQAVIAAAASHHRLLWIHPFLDGNGRVARLFTQAFMIRAGIDAHGIWSISRGLARRQRDYRMALAGADAQRAGDLDGRGQMSDAGLTAYCRYFLEVALDQITFIDGLLRLDGLLERLATMARIAEQNRRLPARTGLVLREAMLRGPLARGDALDLFDQPERTARQSLAAVLRSGLLLQDGLTHKSPVAFAVPTAYGNQLFPGLYPEAPEEDEETDEGDQSIIVRLRRLTPKVLYQSIENMLADHVSDLLDSDVLTDEMARTNATGFTIDDWHIDEADEVDLSSDEEVRVPLSFTLSGEDDPDTDRQFSGRRIDGHANAILHRSGVVTFEDIRGSVADRGDDESSGDDDPDMDEELGSVMTEF